MMSVLTVFLFFTLRKRRYMGEGGAKASERDPVDLQCVCVCVWLQIYSTTVIDLLFSFLTAFAVLLF